MKFTGPVAQGSVLDANSPANLQVSVNVNGTPAVDGTVVTLAVSRATANLSRPLTTTVGGTAASQIQDTLPGALQVDATSTSNTHTGSDRLSLYVRPRPRDLEVLVPAYYTDADTESAWETLISGATSYPDVKVTAIMRVSNG
ncbi:MAG: spherulation-specific family 4 protein, partial [Giesbergeria sp.]